MSGPAVRAFYWLVGPLLAVALVAVAILGHGGPGFFFMSLVGGCLFTFGTPLTQAILLKTEKYRGRDVAALGLALLIVLVVLSVPVVAGVFNFY